MAILHGNAIVGQSGGPTAAINATLSGVIRGAKDMIKDGVIGKIYGMRNGIEGCLSENFVDLGARFANDEDLVTLEHTPAAALGSCRKKLKSDADDPATYEKLFEIFKKYDIRYFFYIGGNDSMDTVNKLSAYAKKIDFEIRVVGVPKTIDNDLMATDHTPGFGSAAKYVAITMKEILRDISVYTVKAVTIVEVMGRDAGWLTTAAALPALSGDEVDFIYLPERIFDTERFVADVKAALSRKNAVLVAISEGIRFADGEYVGASTQSGAVDVFGHKYLAGAGKVLESIVKERIGCKVRSVELNLPQRCASHVASLCDLTESVAVGRAAIENAVAGKTGVMMAFVRESDAPYRCRIESYDISRIANAVRTVPDSYINEEGNGVTEECLAYLAPLIEGEIYPTFEHGMPQHIII